MASSNNFVLGLVLLAAALLLFVFTFVASKRFAAWAALQSSFSARDSDRGTRSDGAAPQSSLSARKSDKGTRSDGAAPQSSLFVGDGDKGTRSDGGAPPSGCHVAAMAEDAPVNPTLQRYASGSHVRQLRELAKFAHAVRKCGHNVYKAGQCPFESMDLIVFGKPDAKMTALLYSVALFMPCYGTFHVVVLPEEMKMARAVIPKELPGLRVKLHAEYHPKSIKGVKHGMHCRKQWGNFWWDNYTHGSTHTMSFDTDSVLGLPVTCSLLYRNKKLWWITRSHLSPKELFKNRYDLGYSRARCDELNATRMDKMVAKEGKLKGTNIVQLMGFCAGRDGMVNFPVVMRTADFGASREYLNTLFQRRPFDTTFLRWVQLFEKVSQYRTWGNILLKLFPDVYDLDPVPNWVEENALYYLQNVGAYWRPAAGAHLGHPMGPTIFKQPNLSAVMPGRRKDLKKYVNAAVALMHHGACLMGKHYWGMGEQLASNMCEHIELTTISPHLYMLGDVHNASWALTDGRLLPSRGAADLAKCG